MSQTKAQLLDGSVVSVAFSAGSAATPSLYFAGDLNTGIYSPGADQVAVATNGTVRLFVDATGNVGVGTTSPTSFGAGAVMQSIVGTTSYGGYLGFTNNVGVQLWADETGLAGYMGTRTNHPLIATTNNIEKLRITSAGLVGIGTSSPAFALDISASTDCVVRARVNSSTSAGFIGSTNNGTNNWFFGSRKDSIGGNSGTDRFNLLYDTNAFLTVTTAGNVGIGTTSPVATLHSRADNAGSGSTPLLIQNRSISANTAVGISFAPNTSDTADRSAIIYGVNSSGGSGNATDLTFHTNANGVSPTERLRIDSSGRVGIGTASPGTQLHLAGSADIRLTNTANTSGFDIGLLGGSSDPIAYVYNRANSHLVFGTNNTERARIDSSGKLLVGTSSASGAAILQVQTPTTLSTTSDNGVSFTNTSTKVYPTTAGFNVFPGFQQNLELGTAQTIDTVTPGGTNFVYGQRNIYTKSAGNTQDIERLNFGGFRQTFIWADANTCKQYVGFDDVFIYQGIDANGRTSSYLRADSISLTPPDGGTQTIQTVYGNSLRTNPAGTNTINVTNSSNFSPNLGFFNFSAGTKTVNITNHAFYENSEPWGVSGTTGTLNATITNLYGLRLRPPFSSTGLTVTNNWGIYQEWSSAKNWFAGESNQFPNITTTASGANAFLDSADSNRLYRSTSSLTYKRDVEDLDSNLADQILNLRPVWYRSKCTADCEDWSWYGLIAEEVAEIDPRFVHYGYQEDAYEFVETTKTVNLQPNDPRREAGIETEEVTKQTRQLKPDAEQVPNGVAYERLVVPLLDIIKRQKSQLDSFEARLAALESK